MARIFISYAREDRPVVQALTQGLTYAGHEVWWDAHLHAADGFREVIESQITAANVILVVWSHRSRASRYVLDEAERAVGRGILLPLQLDGALPLGFGTFNVLNFSNWGGDYYCDVWRQLLDEIVRIAAAPVLPEVRLEICTLHKGLIVSAALGFLLGLAVWLLYSVDNPALTATLGHPLIDSIGLGLTVTTPVALWAAIEVKQSGFGTISLIARRSMLWFVRSAAIALVVVVLAVVAGVLDPSTPKGIAFGLFRAVVIVSAASAFVITAAKLGRHCARRLIKLRKR